MVLGLHNTNRSVLTSTPSKLCEKGTDDSTKDARQSDNLDADTEVVENGGETYTLTDCVDLLKRWMKVSVSLVFSEWRDKDLSFTLCTLSSKDKKKKLLSMKENGRVMDTIVHNKRYGSNNLISRTKDFLFVSCIWCQLENIVRLSYHM